MKLNLNRFALRPLLSTLLLLAFATTTFAAQAKKPLKVFILAGQSNMQGHAQTSTFDHIGMDPKTAPLLKAMRNADGTPRVCEDVWISSIGHDGTQTERHGKLTADYGAAGRGPKIGPEFTFGIYMQRLMDEPILIIKTAWGGKSLHTDFRSPSAGPYEFNPKEKEGLAKKGVGLDMAKAERAELTGVYYRFMLEHVQHVLGDVQRVCPEYDPKQGYELAGFVWFQGWNDMVSSATYPNRSQPGGYDRYSDALTHFIRDVRKDLDAPEMPFVIGVFGVGGTIDKYPAAAQRYKSTHDHFRKAMAAPASMPEFKTNVVAVLTERYWDFELDEVKSRASKLNAKSKELDKDSSLTSEQRKTMLAQYKAELYSARDLEILKGSSNAAYHYNGSAKIMAQIGQGFAQALCLARSRNK